VHTNKNNIIKLINKKDKWSLKGQDDYFLKIIEYYLEIYKAYMKKEHPVLKEKHWERVIDFMYTFSRAGSIYTFNDFCLMIDAYFDTNFDAKIQCDRNILHFATEGILMNRVNEVFCRFDE
jgi:hypothetical protein